jgi:hypothetical protein
MGTQESLIIMPNPSTPSTPPPAGGSFITRVLNADSTKKGAAAAIAGVLVAVISEALWPSEAE